MPDGLDHFYGHLHRIDRPAGRTYSGRCGRIDLRNVGHCPRQARLRVPARRHGPGIPFLCLLSTSACRATPVAAYFGRLSRVDGWAYGVISLATRPRCELRQRLLWDVHVGTGHRGHLPNDRPRLHGAGSWSSPALWHCCGRRVRGHTGWEPFGAVFVALVPMVWMPLLDAYHPQDLVALGLVLAGTACALRHEWIWAGVLVGLAVTSQQFALLVLVPLFVVAPGKQRWRLLIRRPQLWPWFHFPSSSRVRAEGIHAVLLGTGDSVTFGGTVLWESGVRGAPLVFFSRVVPILVSFAIAWWAYRRLGSGVLEPIALISLLAHLPELETGLRGGLVRLQVHGAGRDADHPRHRSWTGSGLVGGLARLGNSGVQPDSSDPHHQRAIMGRSRCVGASLCCSS